jgi:hypothetical protein
MARACHEHLPIKMWENRPGSKPVQRINPFPHAAWLSRTERCWHAVVGVVGSRATTIENRNQRVRAYTRR